MFVLLGFLKLNMPDINSLFLHSFYFPKVAYFILTFTFCKSIKSTWYEIPAYAHAFIPSFQRLVEYIFGKYLNLQFPYWIGIAEGWL